MVGTSLPADRVHEGGIRPSPLAALGPARLPARCRSVGGKEILPFVEYRFGHARGPWHRVRTEMCPSIVGELAARPARVALHEARNQLERGLRHPGLALPDGGLRRRDVASVVPAEWRPARCVA